MYSVLTSTSWAPGSGTADSTSSKSAIVGSPVGRLESSHCLFVAIPHTLLRETIEVAQPVEPSGFVPCRPVWTRIARRAAG